MNAELKQSQLQLAMGILVLELITCCSPHERFLAPRSMKLNIEYVGFPINSYVEGKSCSRRKVEGRARPHQWSKPLRSTWSIYW